MNSALRAGEAQQQDLDGLTLCVLHQPSMWESDGTCPLCEGQRLHAALAAERALTQHLMDTLREILRALTDAPAIRLLDGEFYRTAQNDLVAKLEALLAASTPTSGEPT